MATKPEYFMLNCFYLVFVSAKLNLAASIAAKINQKISAGTNVCNLIIVYDIVKIKLLYGYYEY